MKFFLLTCLLALGLDSITGTSVVIKNSTVYVDEKPLDLTKLEVVEDLPHAKRYLYQNGNTNITITKSKFGDALSVSTVSKLTPEEAKKAQEFQEKLAEKISSKVQKFQNDIDSQIKAVQDKINESLKNIWRPFPFGF